MASFNTHSQPQQHHHHHQYNAGPTTHHSTAAANVLSTALAAGGSNTQQHSQHHLSHHQQHSQQQQHHHHQAHPQQHHPPSLQPHPPPPQPPGSLHSNAAQQHFERSSSTTTSATTTTFLVPVTSSGLAPLDTTTFLSAAAAAAASPHFVTSSPVTFNSPHTNVGGGTSASSSSSSSSYTFVQIKREPCQVSEVTTSNTNHHHHHQHHTLGALTSAAGSFTAAAAAAKTMSSSSLTTLVKIEASSPKVHDMDKGHVTQASGNMVNSSNNTVPIGIAVARKRPQETTAPPPPGPPPSLTSSSTLPLSQQLNKDMNCFGIRVADLGGVGTGCGNFYFTGNGDLMTSSATADELALNAASLQSVNRASSTFWQYPNALPIESVISMSPATVGLQYSREASRGQVVLLPATATSLGLSNCPILCTPTDPFQQAAAAAFVWPSYIPQGTAPATLQPPPNFIFPSMSPHSTLQAAAAAQPYATSLQFLGSNYLTAAAAAAAAAAATSTLCQHNQQTNSTSSSINLSLGGSVVSGAASGTTMSSSSSSTTTRFMSLATAGPTAINDTGQTKGTHQQKALAPAPGPPTLALAPPPSLMAATASSHPPPVPPQPLLIPPSALKLEDWSGADFMTAASKTTTTTLTAAAMAVPPPPTHYDRRGDSHATATTNANATNLLELPAPAAQALNLMRLPTPPTSATIETAAAAAAAASGTPQLPPLLFHAANSSPTPTLLNLSATLNRVTASNTTSTTSNSTSNVSASLASSTNFLNGPPATVSSLTATIGPPTPLGDDMALNFKSNLDGTPPQIVVGVPRVVNPALPTIPSTQPPPQMQDVNIQTDTPVCSEDENSSCPLNQAQCGPISNVEACTTAQCTPPLTQNDELYHDTEAQQPLELTKTHRPPHSPHVESSCVQEDEEEEEYNTKSPLKQPYVADCRLPEKQEESHSVTPALISSSTSACLSGQEDLTGLELLSNISTSSLVKTGAIRVKQEPLDPIVDQNMCHAPAEHQTSVMESNSFSPVDTQTRDQLNPVALNSDHYPTPATPALPTTHPIPISNLTQNEVEPLGGLKLLCALAEQRIQEEEEVQSTTLNATNGLFRPSSSDSPHTFATSSFPQSTFVKPSSSASTAFHMEAQNSSFPSLETLELPSTSGTCFSAHVNGGVGGGGVGGVGSEIVDIPVKRKKHKHSKSSKSSNSNGGSSSKKSQKCGKKNKKKYSKEKKRHKLLAEAQQADLDFDDPQLQQELQNAFQNCADPNYQRMGGKWPTPQEIFSIMESSMRMRLADITRQYRKKKRKLDEISKNKKKKKCSKLQAASQQLSLVGNSTLSSLVATERPSTTTTTSSLTSSPLCDYKFGKFSSKSSTTTTPNYLAPSSFIRFATDSTKSQSHHLHQTHPQFPPPPDLEIENDNTTLIASNTTSVSITTTPVYKPVRLEPSSLAAASAEQRSGSSGCSAGVLRLAQKHASSEKLSHVIVCKERKLGSSTSSRRSSAEEDDEEAVNPPANEHNHHNGRAAGRRSSSTDNDSAIQQSSKSTSSSPSSSASRKMNPIDRSLMLTQDHLFRKETRVLTDMGGLFYAGIMKPLQPPDVYAITLDGERGNKSHIMSREEIFKDTILEVAPKTVEDVPVGTRLCAYWSQQYRCLYPGRAIESESSDDGVTSQEFVSVEFDDGDSGRIRLQNIRYLLSDYPIVEYNDNPLYSLGKQKKANANKTPNNNDTDHHQHQHQNESEDHANAAAAATTTTNNGLDGRLTTNGSHRDYHQATAMEIFAAKRSEKKRNKSLKKKSQNACNANNATTIATTITTNGGTSNVSSASSLAAASAATLSANGTLDATSECLRKHHKHKKRKKHKKHRKNLMEIGIVSEMDKSSFNNKTERTTKEISSKSAGGGATTQQPQLECKKQQQHHPQNLAVYDDDEQPEQEEDAGDQDNTQTEDSQMAEEEEEDDDEDDAANMNLSHIKHETMTNANNQHSISSASQNIKVKTEHLEMEEESTSNLMSEISDEAKADDMIEHNSSKGSKIAAFLPDRQLWGWLGTAYCKFGTKGSKGRIRKQFYKTIKRGKETITVGDCAVFLSTGRPDRPYIGRIESMWENSCNNKIVRVRWFYHPEETTGCPKLKFPGALFESPHEDENDVQTISHRCEVLQFARYFNKFGTDSKQYQSIYDNNDTYYLAGYYNPRLQVLKLQDNIPTLEEQQQQQLQLQLQQQLQHQTAATAATTQQQQQNTTKIIITNNNTNTNTKSKTTE